MKSKLILLIVVVAALASCVLYMRYEYGKADPTVIDIGTVCVAERELASTDGVYDLPVLGGMLHRTMTHFEASNPTVLGEVGTLPYTLPIKVSQTMAGYDISITRLEGDKAETVYDNYHIDPAVTSAFIDDVFAITQPGYYQIVIVGDYSDETGGRTSAQITYEASFEVTMPPPIYVAGRNELQQGDIYTMGLYNLPAGIEPTLETELGPAIFSKIAPGALGTHAEPVPGVENWYAAVPISNHCKPGTYTVRALAGDLVYEESISVSKYDFDFQNMIIDTSTPSVAAAITPEALSEFSIKVGPLRTVFTDEVYWDGEFIMPVDLGDKWFVSTEFGEIRITNGDYATSRSHYGMDFAVPTGTPACAGNAGRVLLAEYLLNTGYTVVIDHGGGLTTYYYHMSALHTETDAMVQKGDIVGEVGSEGYSTGPHLHYEMRIGDQAISPSMLFDPSAGLYSAEYKES